jgi:hypothetical protein
MLGRDGRQKLDHDRAVLEGDDDGILGIFDLWHGCLLGVSLRRTLVAGSGQEKGKAFASVDLRARIG